MDIPRTGLFGEGRMSANESAKLVTLGPLYTDSQAAFRWHSVTASRSNFSSAVRRDIAMALTAVAIFSDIAANPCDGRERPTWKS